MRIVKSIISLLAIFSFFFSSCKKEAADTHPLYSISQFMNNELLAGLSLSFDCKQVFYSSNKSGIYNIYSIQISDGKQQQLTFSKDDSYFLITSFPYDNRFLFSSDKGGNEINHIYLRKESGEIVDLTPWDGVKSDFYDFNSDKSGFYYLSNKRDERYFDVWLMNLSDFKSKLVFRNEKALIFGAISDDKNYAALYETITYEKSNIFIYNIQKKILKKIETGKGIVQNSPLYFSKDNKYLYYLTNLNSEFMYLSEINIETGEKKKIEEHKWDIINSFYSQSGKLRISSINNDSRTEVIITDITNDKKIDIPGITDTEITSIDISSNDSIMAYFLGSSASPRNIYIYNFVTNQNKKLTNTMNSEIDEKALVTAKVIRYKSFDGLDIPAIYYEPKNIKKDKKNPAIVWVHGGPGDQSRVNYNSLYQYFANHGYAIIAVNNRGSSGYGKTFYSLDNKKHGIVDLGDCIEAKKYLYSTGYYDTSKVVIMGRSYGGFMVLAALAFKPNEFAAGVDLFGISDWLRTLKNIPVYWESERNSIYTELGDPVKDESHLKKISPINSADNIVKPLMVLQGLNDPRVLKIESDEIVNSVRKKGIPVEYVVFNDEGHGFLKKENEIKAYETMLDFIDKYIKNNFKK